MLESQAHGKASRPRVGQTHDPTKMWLHQMYNAGDGFKQYAPELRWRDLRYSGVTRKATVADRFWDFGRNPYGWVPGDGHQAQAEMTDAIQAGPAFSAVTVLTFRAWWLG